MAAKYRKNSLLPRCVRHGGLLRTLLLGGGLALTGCATTTIDGRHDLAKEIAASAHLSPMVLQAPPFALSGFARIQSPGAPANVYIEGDGLAWLSKSQPSMNPTPTDPIALRLAAQDTAANVIYLARPCQYSGTTNGQQCQKSYWMGRRYAPEVLQSYNAALNSLKTRYNFSAYNLAGFSGGATVAALLAGQRNDVASLRSIAGNLDHQAHSRVHNVSILASSLNPPQYAAKLAAIPQYHFIGGDDKIVPIEIFRAYAAALPDQRCVQYKIVPNAEHDSGWTQSWPNLLALPVSCQNAP